LAISAGLEKLADQVAFSAAFEEPWQVVEDIATDKLRAFEGTIDPETGDYLDDVYAQNKSLSEHVAADYPGSSPAGADRLGDRAAGRDQSQDGAQIHRARPEAAGLWTAQASATPDRAVRGASAPAGHRL